jgi:hypothetical protein
VWQVPLRDIVGVYAVQHEPLSLALTVPNHHTDNNNTTNNNNNNNNNNNDDEDRSTALWRTESAHTSVLPELASYYAGASTGDGGVLRGEAGSNLLPPMVAHFYAQYGVGVLDRSSFVDSALARRDDDDVALGDATLNAALHALLRRETSASSGVDAEQIEPIVAPPLNDDNNDGDGDAAKQLNDNDSSQANVNDHNSTATTDNNVAQCALVLHLRRYAHDAPGNVRHGVLRPGASPPLAVARDSEKRLLFGADRDAMLLFYKYVVETIQFNRMCVS